MNRRDLETMFGSVPDSFERRVACALRRTKEEEVMKRKIPAALAFALVLILTAGIGLAIGSSLGVLSFIEKNAPLSEAAKEAIQTEFTQEGGNLADVAVRVRDAVSDGKSLFITVEAKAKKPDDVLLATNDYIGPEPWVSVKKQKEDIDSLIRGRDTDSLPRWADIRPDQTIHYVSACDQLDIVSGADDTNLTPGAGYSWRYEGLDTLVYNMVVDLSRLKNPAEELVIDFNPTVFEQQPMDTPNLPEGAVVSHFASCWKSKETVPLTARVKAGKMEARRAVAEVPILFGDVEITLLEITTTPLASYAKIAKTFHNQGNRSNYFLLKDENGELYQDLVINHIYAQGPNPGGDWDDIPLETIYARRGDLPKTITLHAMPMGADPDPNAKLPDDLIIPLTEVP